MNVARLRADDFGKMGEECDDVVLDLSFDGIDAGNVELCGLALFPDLFGGIFRDDAKLGHGVGRMCLDFEPDTELRVRRPDRGHVRAGVARGCHAASPRANAAALRIAAMLAL